MLRAPGYDAVQLVVVALEFAENPDAGHDDQHDKNKSGKVSSVT